MPVKMDKAKSPALIIAVLAMVLGCVVIASAGMGFLSVPYKQVLAVIWERVAGGAGGDPLISAVVWDVRLPRIFTAAIVGAGLSLSGVVFQGILKNPLADPYTLGISAGAAFGACIAFLFNMIHFQGLSVGMCAFAGALITLAVVLYLSNSVGGYSSNNLILSGIIVAAILSAGISFLKYVADERVSVIIFWLMGSFASKTWADAGLVLCFVSIGALICLCFGRDLNLMALGDRAAASLGVDVKKSRLILLAAASLIAAVCVSVSGIIGFVGLLVPHMMRGILGADNQRLMPASLLAGAILLLCADTFTRAVLPSELPIGVLTALIGGPFFCYVFKRGFSQKTGF
ncbi:FecCD family ABC transporter permease [Desulfatibacillum aliphaticivorans]|uniref:FecCD family ABC transporter permease n=1 Tax=Desulfatibacillum aliphaticivorans TaxID=218208 RepID=UPI00041444DC|nr:iron ABC transporter permease [Desulfatibacillum aliphaticivorans]